MTFLLYGANGYTGQLIAKQAADYGLIPIIAGRTEAKVKSLAEQLGYEYRIFDLKNLTATKEALQEVDLVVHAAGPFKYTAQPMIEACISTKTHYVDITGEIEIFELAASYDEAAKAAGIMLLPGGGFDVVPTD